MGIDRQYASIIRIDGAEMPVPSSFAPVYKDYDSKSSGRSESMIMTRDIVRADVRAMTYTWRVQTPDLRTIIAAIKPAKVQVRFFDINQPASAQYSTVDCYADPTREPKLLKWDPYDPEQAWWEITVKFVEY